MLKEASGSKPISFELGSVDPDHIMCSHFDFGLVCSTLRGTLYVEAKIRFLTSWTN
jgi:hypothetical protein